MDIRRTCRRKGLWLRSHLYLCAWCQHRGVRKLLIVVAALLLVPELLAFTPKEGYSKTLLQPSPRPETLIQGLDAEILHRYPAFDLAYVSTGSIPELRRRCASSGVAIGVHDDWDTIALYTGIDARLGLARSIPSGVPDSPYGEETTGTYVVQFIGGIAPEWANEMSAAGVLFVQYIRYNAQICVAKPSVIRSLRGKHYVQFAEQLHRFLKPSLKVQPDQLVNVAINVARASDTAATVERIRRLAGSEIVTSEFSEAEIYVHGVFVGADLETVMHEALVFGAGRTSGVPRRPVSVPALDVWLLGVLAVALAAMGMRSLR